MKQKAWIKQGQVVRNVGKNLETQFFPTSEKAGRIWITFHAKLSSLKWHDEGNDEGPKIPAHDGPDDDNRQWSFPDEKITKIRIARCSGRT